MYPPGSEISAAGFMRIFELLIQEQPGSYLLIANKILMLVLDIIGYFSVEYCQRIL